MLMSDKETPPVLDPLQVTHPYLVHNEMFALLARKMVQNSTRNENPPKRRLTFTKILRPSNERNWYYYCRVSISVSAFLIPPSRVLLHSRVCVPKNPKGTRQILPRITLEVSTSIEYAGKISSLRTRWTEI